MARCSSRVPGCAAATVRPVAARAEPAGLVEIRRRRCRLAACGRPAAGRLFENDLGWQVGLADHDRILLGPIVLRPWRRVDPQPWVRWAGRADYLRLRNR